LVAFSDGKPATTFPENAPMALLVKICGINTAPAADAAVRAGADMGGLVFHPGSPRNVQIVIGSRLRDHMSGKIRVVALLVDPYDDFLQQVAEIVRPDAIQLHGNETPQRVTAIRERFRIPIIKAIAIADTSDLDQVNSYTAVADMFLFDAKAPAQSPETARPGGHGTPFDWQILRGRTFSRPWLLAGGLTPENVARAVAASGAPGVDVSSGVETAPGVKSPELIAQFISAARNQGGAPP
jgi:phosphoribosylanthranilate isomerase